MSDSAQYWQSSDLSKDTFELAPWWNSVDDLVKQQDQWIRKLSLIVYNSSGGEALQLVSPNSTRDAILSVGFNVKKSTNLTPNFFQARIYNLSPQTMAKVIEQSRVQIQAGYEKGNYGILFDGSVTQYIKGKETSVDTYLEIFAADGDQVLNYSIVNTTIAAGSTADQRIETGAKQVGLPISVIQLGNGLQKSLRAYSVIAPFREFVLDNAQANNSDAWIDDGKLCVVKKDQYISGEAVVLSPRTGLVGMPQVTPQGIIARCLLNSKLRVGTLVSIQASILSGVPFLPGSKVATDENGNPTFSNSADPAQLRFPVQTLGQQIIAPYTSPIGIYKIVLLEHSGESRGQPWYSDMVCIALDASGNFLSIPEDATVRGTTPLLP